MEAKQKKSRWSVEGFKLLLKDYLTAPTFVQVADQPDGRLLVKLPEKGGEFYIHVTEKVAEQEFICYFLETDTEMTFPSLAAAKEAAASHCNNEICVQPFPQEQTFLYGPGDGTTSVMVRRKRD